MSLEQFQQGVGEVGESTTVRVRHERAKRAAKRLRVKAKEGEARRKRHAEDDEGSVQEGMRTRAKERRVKGGEGTGGGGATRGGERETP